MSNFVQARTNMVDSQLRPNGITDIRILDAMHAVMRENFVGDDNKPSLIWMATFRSKKQAAARGL
jgi:protein-L-isoaspartate(D-aspartate) O-methyltransferase